MSNRIGRTFGDPPYYYDRGEEITVVFRTDPEVITSVLPPVLKPLGSRGLAVARVMRHERSTFGPYIGVYLGVPALLEDEPVFHTVTGMKTDFDGTVAGREVFGMPLVVGEAEMGWEAGVLKVSAGRGGVDFIHIAVRLEGRTTPPPNSRLKMGTFATRRQVFEKDSTDYVLVGLKGEVDWTDVKHWNATGTLQIVGGEPGDEWSMFPVNEVVETRYNTGGHDVLNRGAVVAEW